MTHHSASTPGVVLDALVAHETQELIREADAQVSVMNIHDALEGRALDADSETRCSIGVVIAGSGNSLPAGLVDSLRRSGQILVIEDYGLHENALVASMRAMTAECCEAHSEPIVSGKGRKSRWNRENRWR